MEKTEMILEEVTDATDVHSGRPSDGDAETKPETPSEPPKPAPETQKASPPATSAPVNEHGLVLPRTASDLLAMCRSLAGTDGVPKRFSKPMELFGALQLLASLKLPFASLKDVASIEGTPSIFGDLPLSLCKASREWMEESHEEFLIDKEYNEICLANRNIDAEIYAAIIRVQRRGGKLKTFWFTTTQANTAGLLPARKRDGSLSPTSPWNRYLNIMITRRARAWALKSVFSDVLNGVAIAEYDFGNAPDLELKDVTSKDVAEELNNL